MTDPIEQAAGASSPSPAHERAPLFSFAHEVAPDPHDQVLQQAFAQAAAPRGTALQQIDVTATREGDPVLKPTPARADSIETDHEMGLGDDELTERKLDQDQGLGL